MNVLVTGGTGFVGSHLIEELVRGGDHVRALIRRGSDGGRVTALGATQATGDLDDEASLRQACAGCQIVYHAAARVEIVGSERQFYETTVAGTRRLVAAAKHAGVKRFVYISSCGVYHPDLLTAGNFLDESTPTPLPPRWFVYGRTKLQAEHVVQAEAPTDMDWVIIRLGYIYGPRNRTMKTYLEPLLRGRTMMIIGDGKNEMALLYVKDAARAIALAGIHQAAAGKILIAAGTEPITQREYFDALADGFRFKRVKHHVPYKFAYFLGWVGEYLAIGYYRTFLRRSAVALTGLPQRVRCDATQRLLNWRPETKFQDGIRRTFDWYRHEFGERVPAAAGEQVPLGQS